MKDKILYRGAHKQRCGAGAAPNARGKLTLEPFPGIFSEQTSPIAFNPAATSPPQVTEGNKREVFIIKSRTHGRFTNSCSHGRNACGVLLLIVCIQIIDKI
jgi:hypothetical protein